MKNVKTTLFLGLTATFITTLSFMAPPRSTGPASAGIGDRTGSPISSGNCSVCHSGGSFSSDLAIVIKDGLGTVVTEYLPGTVYTVEYNVTGTGNGAGVQGVALDASNSQAGTFSNVQANTKITPLGNIEYLEHSAPGTITGGGFKFIADWTAPTAGTGAVSFYGTGNVINLNGSTSGDNPTTTKTISLTEANTVEVAVNEFKSLVSLFPNPTNNNVTLAVKEAMDNLTVEVFSTSGKLLSTNVYNNQSTISLILGNEKGIYFVKVSQDNNEATYRVVKL